MPERRPTLPTLLQIDFPMEGPSGEEMTAAFGGLDRGPIA